jgi:hypothetical protein
MTDIAIGPPWVGRRIARWALRAGPSGKRRHIALTDKVEIAALAVAICALVATLILLCYAFVLVTVG